MQPIVRFSGNTFSVFNPQLEQENLEPKAKRTKVEDPIGEDPINKLSCGEPYKIFLRNLNQLPTPILVEVISYLPPATIHFIDLYSFPILNPNAFRQYWKNRRVQMGYNLSTKICNNIELIIKRGFFVEPEVYQIFEYGKERWTYFFNAVLIKIVNTQLARKNINEISDLFTNKLSKTLKLFPSLSAYLWMTAYNGRLYNQNPEADDELGDLCLKLNLVESNTDEFVQKQDQKRKLKQITTTLVTQIQHKISEIKCSRTLTSKEYPILGKTFLLYVRSDTFSVPELKKEATKFANNNNFFLLEAISRQGELKYNSTLNYTKESYNKYKQPFLLIEIIKKMLFWHLAEELKKSVYKEYFLKEKEALQSDLIVSLLPDIDAFSTYVKIYKNLHVLYDPCEKIPLKFLQEGISIFYNEYCKRSYEKIKLEAIELIPVFTEILENYGLLSLVNTCRWIFLRLKENPAYLKQCKLMSEYKIQNKLVISTTYLTQYDIDIILEDGLRFRDKVTGNALNLNETLAFFKTMNITFSSEKLGWVQSAT